MDYKKQTNRGYRKIYESVYGPIPKGCDIHHKDKDHTNNNIENLQCVTLQEHFDIHFQQEDWGACYMLAKRLKIPEEQRVFIMRENSRKGGLSNKHNKTGFFSIPPERRTKISSDTGKQTAALKKGMFGRSKEEMRTQLQQNRSHMSPEEIFTHHQSIGKGNVENERGIFRHDITTEQRSEWARRGGLAVDSNGLTGKDRLAIYAKMPCWTNGTINKKSLTQPDETFYRGRVRRNKAK
jgi:hypothetical protein